MGITRNDPASLGLSGDRIGPVARALTPDPKDWLQRFLRLHRDRFAPDDWPTVGNNDYLEFGRLWLAAFRDEAVHESEANEASLKLGPNPPRFRPDHLPAVMKMIRQMRGQFLETSNDPKLAETQRLTGAKRIATDQSRRCQYCSPNGIADRRARAREALGFKEESVPMYDPAGTEDQAQGVAYIYHPLYNGSRTIEIEPQPGFFIPTPAITLAHCVCSLGRWMREHSARAFEVPRYSRIWVSGPAGRSERPDEVAARRSDRRPRLAV